MRPFGVMALSGTFDGDPSVAIAASRASAIGVFDTTFAPDIDAVLPGLERLSRLGSGDIGIKVDAGNPELLQELVDRLPDRLRLAVLVPGDPGTLSRQVERLHAAGIRVLLEAVSVDEAQMGRSLGVEGLVAKGGESGGRVGEETTFVLVQRLRAAVTLPIWAHGGIGLHSVGGARALGAAGVVLDAQLSLARDSGLSDSVRTVLSRMDGSETRCLPEVAGESFRLYAPPNNALLDTLDRSAQHCREAGRSCSRAAWRAELRAGVAWGVRDDATGRVLPIGQDAAMAATLAEQFVTVGGMIGALRASAHSQLQAARRLRLLAEDAPLAASHGTRYPIVQGPMTRVSDHAAFAERVAAQGALPFLALALMRGTKVRGLLADTRRMLDGRPWGVGILGFVPPELRREQLSVVREYGPSFAIIAGGRPDQALVLERAGVPTYLHVPSPGLLNLFLAEGARRFVFEGRECGGHVGPRSSFVLWDVMVQRLLRLSRDELAECHVLFAGGVHDRISAAAVAAIAAPLAEAGARVGVLLGSAYLFTEEAVTSGAIVSGFQRMALSCRRTVLLETGPGHATRCADTRYAAHFERERQRLRAAGGSATEVREQLERLNLGRLRLASKGLERGADGQHPDGELRAVDEDRQVIQGMYMIGQVGALRDTVVTMAELHRDVSAGSCEWLARFGEEKAPVAGDGRRGCDIAIVGMSCLLPGAPRLATYWHNILHKVDAVGEVPAQRWDWRRYFDPDRSAPDRVYSRWGGFLDDVAFEPLRWGIPPNALPSTEPLQLLTLLAAHDALADAGYATRPFPRARTAVILGVGGGIAELGAKYVLRAELPRFADGVPPKLLDALPVWTEDSFPGILLNVVAGRVANRLDLGGVNYTVDAACASSLAAVYAAAQELALGSSDMVIAGGADTVQNPFAYLCFSKTQALSPSGRCRPFDAKADGIAISEGAAVLVLKRLADAERDGDRVYAVLKGIAGASDGRAKGLTAPRPEGQALALHRAYDQAGFAPSTVGLIEAHGTGTVAGDQAEAATLTRVFEGAEPHGCALGSVKSMIGHTKCAAGVAGLVKAALALHHGVLPATLNVDTPNPALGSERSPFYVNTESRPWIGGRHGHPRRAGVSAFGFGGTNFHAVLEEYTAAVTGPQRAPIPQWPAELMVWGASSRTELADEVDRLRHVLDAGAGPELRDLAATLAAAVPAEAPARLAVVTSSIDELRGQLASAAARMTDDAAPTKPGVHLAPSPAAGNGRVAFVFPGQGAQYPDMLRELAVYMEPVRTAFQVADQALAGRLPEPLSTYVYPPPRFGPDADRACAHRLTATNVAQPALGAVECGVLGLFHDWGLRPDAVCGHSYGELVALHAAGVFTEEQLYLLSETRGRAMVEAAGAEPGAMSAVAEDPERVSALVAELADVWVANANAPRQTVLSGTTAGLAGAAEVLRRRGIDVHPLAVACGFHSPLVAPATEHLARYLATMTCATPRIPVYSNATAAPYPDDPAAVAGLLATHLVRQVRFAEQVRRMYDDGLHIFVEIGPRTILSGLIGQILVGFPHVAVAVEADGGGIRGLLSVVATLWAMGVRLDPTRLLAGRGAHPLNGNALEKAGRSEPGAWLVNGGAIRPANGTATPGPGPSPARATWTTAVAAPACEASGAGEPARPPAAAPAPRDTSPMLPAAGRGPVVTGPVSSPVGTAPGGRNSHRDDVLIDFQRLMHRFLDTQEQVMRSYLRGAGPAVLTTQTPAAGDAAVAAPVPGVPSGRGALPEPAPAAPAPADTPRADAPAMDAQTVATDRDAIAARVIALVSERTGYPAAVLDVDADLESDLGVDSIKRIEILGALLRSPGMPATIGAGAMEEATRARTVRAIADRLHAATSDADRWVAPDAEPDRTSPGPSRAYRVTPRTPDAPSLPRCVMVTTEWPLPAPSAALPTGPIVVTDDGIGTADHLVARLRAGGCPAVAVRPAAPGTRPGAGADGSAATADLTDPDAIASLLARVRHAHGPIAGLIHLLPLQPGDDIDAMSVDGWNRRLRNDVRALFHLARAAAADLRGTAERGPAWLLAATRLGGAFGFTDPPGSLLPTHGGVAGLVKGIAQEWPEVNVRVVDFDDLPPADVAIRLLDELAAPGDEVEIGYQHGRRTAPRALPWPLVDETGVADPLGPESVLLVTGGARGITGLTTRYLAERYRPTVVIVGRSPAPDVEEPAETAGITQLAELKTALTTVARRQHAPAGPEAVEQAYRRLMRQREAAANLAALRAAGATVSYRQADVRDATALSAVVADIYRTYGRLDGLLHGAGVIDDKLITDKSPDSFDAVFDTKVQSAFTLCRVLDPRRLRLAVFFSSVAGRIGNRGQSDYASANETMSKLAVALQRRCPGRVLSVHWAPWREAGMVTPELRRHFEARGVPLVDPAVGVRALDRELRLGQRGTVEVMLGDGPWMAAGPAERPEPAAPVPLPLLGTVVASGGAGGWTETELLLDAAIHRFLDDHRLDGRPVLPAAVALEIVAEAAVSACPGWDVQEIGDLRVLRGVVLDAGSCTVRVAWRLRSVDGQDEAVRVVDVAITAVGEPATAYYQATVTLRRQSGPPPIAGPAPAGEEAFPLDAEEAYRQWLFHGPALRCVRAVVAFGREGIVATLDPPDPAGDWVVDPVVVDGAPQLVILWARARLGVTALPSAITRYRRFAALRGPLECRLEVRPGADATTVVADATFIRGAAVVGRLEGLTCTGSATFNRLAGSSTTPAGDVR